MTNGLVSWSDRLMVGKETEKEKNMLVNILHYDTKPHRYSRDNVKGNQIENQPK